MLSAIGTRTSGPGVGTKLTGNKLEKIKQFDEELSREAKLQSDKKSSGKDNVNEKLMETANKIEGLVLGLLIKQMRSTVKHKGPFSGGYAGKVFRERLDAKYAQKMADSQKYGIAEKVYDQFINRLGAAKTS